MSIIRVNDGDLRAGEAMIWRRSFTAFATSNACAISRVTSRPGAAPALVEDLGQHIDDLPDLVPYLESPECHALGRCQRSMGTSSLEL